MWQKLCHHMRSFQTWICAYYVPKGLLFSWRIQMFFRKKNRFSWLEDSQGLSFWFSHLPSSCLFSLPRCCHWRPRPQVVSIAMASWFQICRQETWAFFFRWKKKGGLNGAGGLLMLGDTSPPRGARFGGWKAWRPFVIFFEVMTGWIYSKFQKTSEHLPWSLEIEQEVNSE